MPSSATEGKSQIKKWLNELINSSDFKILDLGCGRGTYGRLITKPCYKVAVDAMPYKEKFGLLDFYDKFYQRDIRDTDFLAKLGYFDLIIMGDVLEHLRVSEARAVLDSLEKQCDRLMVAVPYLYWQMWSKNHWEDHLQPDLTPSVFAERYPEFKLMHKHTRKAPPWNGGDFYGYYLWEKEAGNGTT